MNYGWGDHICLPRMEQRQGSRKSAGDGASSAISLLCLWDIYSLPWRHCSAQHHASDPHRVSSGCFLMEDKHAPPVSQRGHAPNDANRWVLKTSLVQVLQSGALSVLLHVLLTLWAGSVKVTFLSVITCRIKSVKQAENRLKTEDATPMLSYRWPHPLTVSSTCSSVCSVCA